MDARKIRAARSSGAEERWSSGGGAGGWWRFDFDGLEVVVVFGVDKWRG